MRDDIKSCLKDIHLAIKDINRLLSDQRDFFHSKKVLNTSGDVVWHMESIGQAVSRILKSDPDFSMTNVKKILDISIRILLGYDSPSDTIIWSLVTRDLIDLQHEVSAILDQ
jgi:uncharacterized protein with HEPN domain